MTVARFFLLGFVVVGCSQKASICEFAVDDIPVCVDSVVGAKYCRQEWDGEPSPFEDGNCEDIGYVQCEGEIEVNGEGKYFSAQSEEDCEILAGTPVESEDAS